MPQTHTRSTKNSHCRTARNVLTLDRLFAFLANPLNVLANPLNGLAACKRKDRHNQGKHNNHFSNHFSGPLQRRKARMPNTILFVFSAVGAFRHQLSRGFIGPMYFFATTTSSNQTLLIWPSGASVIYSISQRKFKFSFSSLRH
jgi:hypothetical protein